MRHLFLCCIVLLPLSQGVMAMDDMAMADHDSTTFHVFKLQADTGQGQDNSISSWDLDGWIGGDDNKLWLKVEGEKVSGTTDQSELWALYSRNVATFWDVQAGLRYDQKPASTSYVVLGMNGLAPYFFETEAHLFVSDEGDVSARLREENDFLITQQWIIKPYAELNWFAQNVSEQQVGVGFSSAELGLQVRYEITRKFAPYFDLRYTRLLENTASIADSNGEDKSDVIASIGLQLMF